MQNVGNGYFWVSGFQVIFIFYILFFYAFSIFSTIRNKSFLIKNTLREFLRVQLLSLSLKIKWEESWSLRIYTLQEEGLTLDRTVSLGQGQCPEKKSAINLQQPSVLITEGISTLILTREWAAYDSIHYNAIWDCYLGV